MQNGFSLIKSAIVLVVIGLIGGGVFVGKSMLRAAELQNIITDFEKYHGAALQFKQKYASIPGDFTSATKIWGKAAEGEACRTTTTNDARTCDGNGNGLVFARKESNESFRFWQHLANAGLIEGAYTGISAGKAPWVTESGLNVPKQSISGSDWFIWAWPNYLGDVDTYQYDYLNFFQFGAHGPETHPWAPSLTPNEAWDLDTKMDDGLPGRGKLMAGMRTDCTDSTSATDYMSGYKLSSGAVACSLLFPRLFVSNTPQAN